MLRASVFLLTAVIEFKRCSFKGGGRNRRKMGWARVEIEFPI